MLAPASVSDYRELARRRLPRVFFDYVDGGAFDEATLNANRNDLQRLALKQKVLRDVSALDTSVILFGQKLELPLVLAPVGFAGMMARRAANCGALVFTVDLPVLGTRYRDIRNGFGVKLSALGRMRLGWNVVNHPAWVYDVPIKGRPLTFGNLSGIVPNATSLGALLAWTTTALDPSVTWKDLAWVRSLWKGPLIIKGVLDEDDAREAVAAGAEGIVVSNHGGRQLDAALSTIAVLPKIAEAVGDKTTILMDGGIRSGQDVTRALALGAKACMIGRAWVYGVAAKGEAGVTGVLETMKRELRTSMALIGRPRVGDIDASVLQR